VLAGTAVALSWPVLHSLAVPPARHLPRPPAAAGWTGRPPRHRSGPPAQFRSPLPSCAAPKYDHASTPGDLARTAHGAGAAASAAASTIATPAATQPRAPEQPRQAPGRCRLVHLAWIDGSCRPIGPTAQSCPRQTSRRHPSAVACTPELPAVRATLIETPARLAARVDTGRPEVRAAGRGVAQERAGPRRR
jgi:hypothetical protein